MHGRGKGRCESRDPSKRGFIRSVVFVLEPVFEYVIE